jgi:hypothetical protein
MRMPRPPPPADAFNSSGKPTRCAISAISSRSATAPSDPGVVGTPASRAARFASILSPINRIISAVGPTKITSSRAQRSANAGFSARKP